MCEYSEVGPLGSEEVIQSRVLVNGMSAPERASGELSSSRRRRVRVQCASRKTSAPQTLTLLAPSV